MSRADGLCGPNCRYRALYEGAQTSLGDMAAKQAHALSRAGRLRNGLIMLLKRTWPGEFSEAELHAGQRMSDLDDELLLAYADSFLSLVHRLSPLAGAEQLRQALVAAGYELPENSDLASWARAIADRERPADDARADDEAPAVPSGVDIVRDAEVRAGQLSTSQSGRRRLSDLSPTAPASSVPMATSAARPVLEEHQGHDDAQRRAEDLEACAYVPEDDGDDWLDAFDSGGEVPPPYEPGGSAGPPRDEGPSSGAFAPPGDDLDELSRLFETGEEGSEAGERREAAASDGLGDLAALFADEGPDASESAPSQDQADETADAPAARASVLGDTAPLQRTRRRRHVTEGEQVPLPAAHPGATAPSDADGPMSEAAEGGDVPDTASTREGRSTKPAPSAPLRPVLVPPETRRRRATRVPRTSAAVPDAFDVPPELASFGAELTDTVRKALLATVAVPRPIFASDLEAVAGSMDLVQAWIAECHSSTDNEIRVLSAKPRHRTRGALLLPAGLLRSSQKKSLWLSCIERYARSAKLYEIGVLLHRVSEDVIAHRLGEHTLLLRLSQPRGVVGVIVSLDQRPHAEEASGAAVIADLEELLAERLSLVAVLSIYAEGPDRLIPLITEEARTRRWAPTFPVVVARSWEYADNGGSSADLVLGG